MAQGVDGDRLGDACLRNGALERALQPLFKQVVAPDHAGARLDGLGAEAIVQTPQSAADITLGGESKRPCNMKFLKLVATVMSLAIAGLGVLGVAAPAVLLEFGGSLLAAPALYWVAAVRVVFGALLILVAAESRMPRTLRVIGILVVVAGLLTPLLGTERFREAFTWFSGQGPLLVRATAVLPLIVGLFFVYAINSHRRVAA